MNLEEGQRQGVTAKNEKKVMRKLIYRYLCSLTYLNE